MGLSDIPKGTIDAARMLLGEATRTNVHQVHDISLRDIDANEEKPKVLTLIPLGGVLGVGIRNHDDSGLEDKDLIFVSMAALANCLPALGFTWEPVAGFLIPPKDAV